MAKYGSDQIAFFLVGGYSLRGFLTDFSDEVEKLTEESTVLGDSWQQFSDVGLKRAALAQNGYYDDAAGASNEALVGLSGSDRVAMYGLAGNVIGRSFRGMAGALQATYQRVMQRGALHRANATYKIDGAFEDGKLVHAHSAETTASGNSQASSVDNAASSANGGSAYVAVSALTLGGYTNVTLKTRHSADNSTFADLANFTNVAAAPTAERVAVAGTINRYTASLWLFNGAGAGPSVTFAMGVVRA